MGMAWDWVVGDWVGERRGGERRGGERRGGDLRVGVTTSRRELTTSTVIVAGSQALLVDPCWDPDELAWMATSLAAMGITVTAGFSSHPHHDHLLWHPRLPAVPRWASEATVRVARANRHQLIAALGPAWSGELGDQVAAISGAPGPEVPWAGTRIIMITHNAHAPGHTALWVPAARVLVAGDMLSDVELPLLEESTPDDYLGGLNALRPFAGEAEVLIPGHGRPATGDEPVARWLADRNYLTGLAAGGEVPGEPADERRRRPGMRQAHLANLARVEQIS